MYIGIPTIVMKFHKRHEASMYLTWEFKLFDSIGTPIMQMEASNGHKGTSTLKTEELPGEVPCWKSGSPCLAKWNPRGKFHLGWGLP